MQQQVTPPLSLHLLCFLLLLLLFNSLPITNRIIFAITITTTTTLYRARDAATASARPPSGTGGQPTNFTNSQVVFITAAITKY